MGVVATNITAVRVAVRNFVVDEGGPTAIEYAVVLSLVVAMSVPAIRILAAKSYSAFSNAANTLATSSDGHGVADDGQGQAETDTAAHPHNAPGHATKPSSARGTHAPTQTKTPAHR